jgi:hypothetical protein
MVVVVKISLKTRFIRLDCIVRDETFHHFRNAVLVYYVIG